MSHLSGSCAGRYFQNVFCNRTYFISPIDRRNATTIESLLKQFFSGNLNFQIYWDTIGLYLAYRQSDTNKESITLVGKTNPLKKLYQW